MSNSEQTISQSEDAFRYNFQMRSQKKSPNFFDMHKIDRGAFLREPTLLDEEGRELFVNSLAQ
jgi:predicted ATPase